VIRFHVDVNIGDPIHPAPTEVRLPRLLGGEIVLSGYPLEMVLAEKLITALERATVNTRWRDFADIYLLAGAHTISAQALFESVRAVANHRVVPLRPLRQVLDEYGDLAQSRWAAWRRKQALDTILPEQFTDVLASSYGSPIRYSNTGLTSQTRSGNGNHKPGGQADHCTGINSSAARRLLSKLAFAQLVAGSVETRQRLRIESWRQEPFGEIIFFQLGCPGCN
jgi:hypothetical protein